MNSVDLLRLYIGGNPLAEYASVTFLVKNGAGQYESCSTKDLNLVPLSPLHVNAFEENCKTVSIPAMHGVPEYPAALRRVYKNATGTWEFYYVQDGTLHASWDDYGANSLKDWVKVRMRCGIPGPNETSLKLYHGWHTRTGEWSSTYYRLMRFIQGKDCKVRMHVDASAVSGPRDAEYEGRCWVSSVKPSEGKMVFAISYNFAPQNEERQ